MKSAAQGREFRSPNLSNFQIFQSSLEHGGHTSYKWHGEGVDCCQLVSAGRLALQHLLHLLPILRYHFVANLLVVVSIWMQDTKIPVIPRWHLQCARSVDLIPESSWLCLILQWGYNTFQSQNFFWCHGWRLMSLSLYLSPFCYSTFCHPYKEDEYSQQKHSQFWSPGMCC